VKAPAKKTTKTGKPAAKKVAGKALPVAKTAPKAPKVVASAKKAASPAKSPKPAAKATPAKTPSAAKSASKAPVKGAGKTASKPVIKPPVVKSTSQTPPKAPSKPVTKTASKAQASQTTSTAASKRPVAQGGGKAAGQKASAATPVVQPTPRPMGKRAAKKMMMEQMTQAAVVPTHAPDAAKATFSTMNERAVMTPPVPTAVRKDPKRANNWKTIPVDQLTDEDVLAMPDSEYMSDLQLAFFRNKLCKLRDDMLANAGETTEHLREDTVVVPDPADRATIEEEHALELRTRDRERKLLKKIGQAISRVDAGEYGYCDETGEAIGVGRLMARPTASLSLEAQQRRELKQKMFGD
jgi:DnaK suppressor protein